MPDGRKLEIFSQDADRLIAAHDAEVALLYIYELRTGCMDDERTARDLCMTLRAVRETREKLERMTKPADAAPRYAAAPELSDEIPEYTSADVVKRSESDPAFSAIVAEATRIMGKTISSPDLKVLFGIYEHLGMPAEVVMLMLNYCAVVYERKYGTQRRPSMNAFRKEALYWADREILTMEAAEEYIEWQNRRTSDVGRIKEALGIRGRELVKSELEKINSWLDMGFSEETIAIAYERTVTNTGGLKWNYMDKIIRSWKEKNLMTPQEVEEKDGRRPATSKTAGKAKSGDMSKYFNALDDALNKI